MRRGIFTVQPTDVYAGPIADLGCDFVQVPFHLCKPSEEFVKVLSEKGVDIHGKFIPEKDFVRVQYEDTVLRIFDENPYIAEWDFGGEPETLPSQPGCRWSGSVDTFIDLLAYFREKAHVRKNVPVTGCGFISATMNSLLGNPDRTDFFRNFVVRGGCELLDAITLNHFVYGYGGEKNILAGQAVVRLILSRFGRDHAVPPLFVSETGVPCGGDPKYLHIIQTVEQQAASLVKNMVLFASTGVKSVCWFTFHHHAWGILGKVCSPRPAYTAYQFFNKIVPSDLVYIKQRKLATPVRYMVDHIEWHEFGKDDESYVAVVWSDSGRVEIPVSNCLRICDLEGHDLDTNLLTIDRDPMYVVSDVGFSSFPFF